MRRSSAAQLRLFGDDIGEKTMGFNKTPPAQAAARDAALDTLQATRGGLIEAAHRIALQIAKERGRVTAVEVFHEMHRQGFTERLGLVDGRWMGAVFRAQGGLWKRVGWEPTGSHGRPVAVWTRG